MPVRLVGDIVELWENQAGLIVCSLDDQVFPDGFPKSEWGYLERGAIIRCDALGLVHYETADEDFRVLSKQAVKAAS